MNTLRRTDGAEQECAFVALVCWLNLPSAAMRALPHEAVLLAYTRRVLEPNLDLLARHAREVGSEHLR